MRQLLLLLATISLSAHAVDDADKSKSNTACKSELHLKLTMKSLEKEMFGDAPLYTREQAKQDGGCALEAFDLVLSNKEKGKNR